MMNNTSRNHQTIGRTTDQNDRKDETQTVEQTEKTTTTTYNYDCFAAVDLFSVHKPEESQDLDSLYQTLVECGYVDPQSTSDPNNDSLHSVPLSRAVVDHQPLPDDRKPAAAVVGQDNPPLAMADPFIQQEDETDFARNLFVVKEGDENPSQQHHMDAVVETMTTSDTARRPLRPQDIVCEKGGLANHHPGNLEYMDELEELSPTYQTLSSRLEKSKFVDRFFAKLTVADDRQFLKREKGERCDNCKAKKRNKKKKEKLHLPCLCSWKALDHKKAKQKVTTGFYDLDRRKKNRPKSQKAIKERPQRLKVPSVASLDTTTTNNNNNNGQASSATATLPNNTQGSLVLRDNPVLTAMHYHHMVTDSHKDDERKPAALKDDDSKLSPAMAPNAAASPQSQNVSTSPMERWSPPMFEGDDDVQDDDLVQHAKHITLLPTANLVALDAMVMPKMDHDFEGVSKEAPLDPQTKPHALGHVPPPTVAGGTTTTTTTPLVFECDDDVDDELVRYSNSITPLPEAANLDEMQSPSASRPLTPMDVNAFGEEVVLLEDDELNECLLNAFCQDNGQNP